MQKALATIIACVIIVSGCVKRGNVEFTKTADKELYDKLGDYRDVPDL